MEATESTEQGEWAAWKQAVEAGWRGEEPPRTHVELDGGEIVLPAFHPHRTVSSIRSRSEEPWRISVDIHAAAEVMPALIGGAEAVRLIGCDRPAAWLDGVIREYVDIEWVGDLRPPPSCLKLTDCRSREACCWIGGQDWISVPIWRWFRRRADGNDFAFCW